MRGWSHEQSQRGIRRRYGRERFGWCWSTRRSTILSGRPWSRWRRSLGARRRRCASGCVGRGVQGMARTPPGGPCRGPMHGGAADGRVGASWRGSGSKDEDDPGSEGTHPATGPSEPGVRGQPPECVVGGGLNLCGDMERLRLRCLCGRCLRPAYASPTRCTPNWPWTPLIRPSVSARWAVSTLWCITATVAPSTCPSATPSVWPRPGSSPRWAASGTPTTTPWPSPSSACTRPR